MEKKHVMWETKFHQNNPKARFEDCVNGQVFKGMQKISFFPLMIWFYILHDLMVYLYVFLKKEEKLERN